MKGRDAIPLRPPGNLLGTLLRMVPESPSLIAMGQSHFWDKLFKDQNTCSGKQKQEALSTREQASDLRMSQL